MDTNKTNVVQLLDKDEVEYGDEYLMAWSDEGVLACLDNNDKDGFGVYFVHAHPLEYILEETLGDLC